MDVPETVLINFNDKKTIHKMDYYILHTFLLVTIMLLKIATICYYCIQHRSKQNTCYHINNIKWQRMMK